MRFFMIHGISYDDDAPNPVILANSAREAGAVYCRRNNLAYVPIDQSAPEDTTSECFVSLDTLPTVWAPDDSDEYQRQIDNLDQFFVDAVCLGPSHCIECKSYAESGITISLEDANLIQTLLNA